MHDIESNVLIDKFNRPINYLRLAVTDRCNLRCFYCMPEKGMKYLPKKELLTFEEIIRLVTIFSKLGVTKLRLTGGEPFVRKDLIQLISACNEIEGIRDIHMTTNGVLTAPFINSFKEIGIKSVNLSIDSLDRERFKKITRYDELPVVLDSFHALLAEDIPTKLNMVVMSGKNEEDIIPLAELALKYKVGIRYIEEMPFKGEKEAEGYLRLNHISILDKLKANFPDLQKVLAPKYSTAELYKSESFVGDIGIIPAFTRTFCGSCNRIRLTSQGEIKTCLYGDASLNLKNKMREGASNNEIAEMIKLAVQSKPKNGFEAEKTRANKENLESMSTIGG